jgi:hypothetical protein
MDDLDLSIREALRHGATAATQLDVATIVGGAARKRRRRRVASGAVALVLLATSGAVVLAVTSSGTPSSTPATRTGEPVPWIDNPGVLPTPTPEPTFPPLYPQCRADQLTATGGRVGVAAGNLSNEIDFRNTASSACSLSGYPTQLVGIRSDGREVPLSPEHGGYAASATAAAGNLQPGQIAMLILGTGDACGALNRPTPLPGNPYASVRIGMPGGGTLTAVTAFDTICGLEVSTFGVHPPVQAPPTDPYPGLRADLEAPAEAVAGTTLQYVVALTNTGSMTQALDPCPAYQQGFKAVRPVPGALLLNCRPIEPGQTLRFAMRLEVPEASGQVVLSWGLPGSEATARADLLVTSR